VFDQVLPILRGLPSEQYLLVECLNLPYNEFLIIFGLLPAASIIVGDFSEFGIVQIIK
jgi:hypothetical protein